VCAPVPTGRGPEAGTALAGRLLDRVARKNGWQLVAHWGGGHSRCLLAGLRWVLGTAATWRETPEQFGPWHPIDTRSRDWCHAGNGPDLRAALTPNPPVNLSYLSR
jgi:transposase